jgi:hypothetical protein
MFRVARYSTALIFVISCDVTDPPVDQLLLTVSVSERAIHLGDTTEITVRATNPTNRDVEFSSNSCVLAPQVVDAERRDVYGGQGACNDILLVHRLAPGEYLEETFEFDGWGVKGWEEEFERYPLEPGTYWVRGGVTARRGNPSPWVPLQIEPAGS